jgi:hypothetical protein
MFPVVGPVGSEVPKHQIQRSLRFNPLDSAYLSRTPSNVGNRKLLSFRVRIKRAALGSVQVIVSAGTAGIDRFYFDASDRLCLDVLGTTCLVTTPVYRDPTAWYVDVGFLLDVANPTAQNRAKILINGSEVLAYTTDMRSAITNTNTNWNDVVVHYLGRDDSGNYFSGYLCEPCLVDGGSSVLYSQIDSDTGARVSVKPVATWGVNGFYLDFSDNSNTTATTLGADRSGNGNNFTPVNFSVAAGVSNDSLVDTPTNHGTDTGVGGEVSGNYCVWNPLELNASALYNGNLQYIGSGGKGAVMWLESGKWYAEFIIDTFSTYIGFGFAGDGWDGSVLVGNTADSWALEIETTNNWIRNNSSVTGAGLGGGAAGVVMMLALDMDNKKAWLGRNGVWYNSGNPANGTNPTATNIPNRVRLASNSAFSQSNYLNCGQYPYTYTAPTGFKAICTGNFPDPAIAAPEKYFTANTRAGTGSAGAVTGKKFKPDFIWSKSWSVRGHMLANVVRGVGKYFSSDSAADETVDANAVTAFNSDGFSFGNSSILNTNAENYVDWLWRKGAISGFDVVTYTGNGTNRTINHSLGVAPGFVMVKALATAGADVGAQVWHNKIANTEYLVLDSTAAKDTGTTHWNSTSPTSSVFSLGTAAETNANGDTFIAYLFAGVAGFSKMDSYTGNGSVDGKFVYCGFEPAFLLVKRVDAAGGWYVWDMKRSPYNPVSEELLANSSAAEGGMIDIDLLSVGFKLRSTDADLNASGGTYVYVAFAAFPDKYSSAV